MEVDLAEAGNAETFATNFAGNPYVHVPRAAWELTTRWVLTLENVTAIKLSDHQAITEAGIGLPARAHRVLTLVAGAIVYGTDPGFGRILTGASLIPLLWVLFASRARHPGMR